MEYCFWAFQALDEFSALKLSVVWRKPVNLLLMCGMGIVITCTNALFSGLNN